ncbi:MAG: hypothetical protein V1706_01235 [Pseudomonadota bacterium]
MSSTLPAKAVFLLLFQPAKFVALSVQHDIAAEFETNKQFLQQYPNRVLPPERLKNFEDNSWDRTKKIRVAFFTALWSTTLAIVVGILAGHFVSSWFGKPSSAVSSALQVGGAGVILIATLALLGWEIQSCKGQSLPEKANRWLFRIQYWFGTVLFVFSLSWTL